MVTSYLIGEAVAEVFYGSRTDAGKSAAEVTKKRESSGDFGDTGLNVSQDSVSRGNFLCFS